eukprot:GHRQ01022714.1.p2 GENE.GHRQ01022714.1~~GHRQ01022714.1.p2  ORF type:complete len:106 (+),score=11.07 GHRQ01022714.1:576-893(+)
MPWCGWQSSNPNRTLRVRRTVLICNCNVLTLCEHGQRLVTATSLHCVLLFVCWHQVMTSTRKGNKKLAIYDLKITMKWEAQAEDGADQVRSQAPTQIVGQQLLLD